jgi:hypothetical protein
MCSKNLRKILRWERWNRQQHLLKAVVATNFMVGFKLLTYDICTHSKLEKYNGGIVEKTQILLYTNSGNKFY